MDPKCAQMNAGKRLFHETVVVTPDGGLANAFVKLEGAFPQTPVPTEPVVVDQRGCVYGPRVVGVRVGQVLQVRNSDDVLHNVFCPDKCTNKMNLGTWPKGKTKSFTYTTPCASTVLCNVHPEMQAYVVVVETPWFTVSAKDGSYAIKDVPAGTYTLKIWHEKLKGAPVSVTVPATGSVKQDFALAK